MGVSGGRDLLYRAVVANWWVCLMGGACVVSCWCASNPPLQAYMAEQQELEQVDADAPETYDVAFTVSNKVR